jgi:hypothetical protein
MKKFLAHAVLLSHSLRVISTQIYTMLDDDDDGWGEWSELNEYISPFLVLPPQQSPDLCLILFFSSSSSSRDNVMNN